MTFAAAPVLPIEGAEGRLSFQLISAALRGIRVESDVDAAVRVCDAQPPRAPRVLVVCEHRGAFGERQQARTLDVQQQSLALQHSLQRRDLRVGGAHGQQRGDELRASEHRAQELQRVC